MYVWYKTYQNHTALILLTDNERLTQPFIRSPYVFSFNFFFGEINDLYIYTIILCSTVSGFNSLYNSTWRKLNGNLFRYIIFFVNGQGDYYMKKIHNVSNMYVCRIPSGRLLVFHISLENLWLGICIFFTMCCSRCCDKLEFKFCLELKKMEKITKFLYCRDRLKLG